MKARESRRRLAKFDRNGGEGMTGMLAVGVLLIALGVVFLAVPLEQLQKVFRRMRSRIGTKIGGAVLVAAGIALALY